MIRTVVPAILSGSRALVSDRYISTTHRLHFLLKYMHKVANERDSERLTKFGPDRTCAEWILRNGGRVRFSECEDWLSDYNLLPPEDESEHFHVQDVDASGAELMYNGFLHLDRLKHLQSMKIHDCRYVDDNCMSLLSKVEGSLRRLQISSCKEITGNGLSYLHGLGLLEELYLKDLGSVSDKIKSYEDLKLSLPQCRISYPDAEKLISQKK